MGRIHPEGIQRLPRILNVKGVTRMDFMGAGNEKEGLVWARLALSAQHEVHHGEGSKASRQSWNCREAKGINRKGRLS